MEEYQKKIRNLGKTDEVELKISELLNKYSDILKKYVSEITKKSYNDITDNELKGFLVDIIYIYSNGEYKNEFLTDFMTYNEEEVKTILTKDALVREILNKKFGIKSDYKFKGEIGDNRICDSIGFNLDELNNVFKLDILPEQFIGIYEEYINCILDVVHRNRNLDIYLKWDEKHNSDDKVKEEFNLFFDGKEPLEMSTKVILLEMFNLVSTYSLDELLNKKESVKKELRTGIYDFIKMPNPKLTQKEREMIGEISDIWTRDDIVNYTNLSLLEKRYFDILNNNNIKEIDTVGQNISIIQKMIENGIPKNEIGVDSVNNFKIQMDKVYSDFEQLNKEDIINSVYSPKDNINFNNRESNNIPDTMLVHFYSPNPAMEDIFNIIAINRQRVSNNEEPIELKNLRDIFGDSSIKEQIKDDKLRFSKYINEQEIKDSVDELQPEKSFKVQDSDVGVPRRDVLEVSSNQLACYLINKESLINLLNKNDNRMKTGNGNIAIAVGFSKTTVPPENILVSCDMNANSNLGVDNIPCEDPFTDLSKTYSEISEVKDRRTEVLLKRDGIKADYLMIMKSKDITEYEQEIIKKEQERAEKLGLNIVNVDIQPNYKEIEDDYNCI